MKTHDPEGIELKTIRRHIELRKDAKVLEVGIGDAKLGYKLAPLVSGYWGLDTDTRMLRIARNRSERVFLVGGSVGKAPFASGSFDVVLCPYVLHHVENKEAALSEIVRIMRRGAAFMSIDVAPGSDYLSLKAKLRPRSRGFVEKRWKAVFDAIKNSGLKVRDVGQFQTWYLLPTLEHVHMFFEEFGIEYGRLDEGMLDAFLEERKVEKGYKISESANFTVARKGG